MTNVFSSEFPSESIGHRCVHIHKAVRNSFWSNEINNYTLNEAFKTSSRHRHPTAIIIHYEVQIMYHASRNMAQINHPLKLDGKDHFACEGKGSCTINIGWSSASIYTFIRPDFILSLQPAWFLSSLNFSIHENFGFLNEITFYIHLQYELISEMKITTYELKHSLEQITAKVTKVYYMSIDSTVSLVLY